MRRPRLAYIVTHPVTGDLLLRGQLAFMREHGFDVTMVASPGPELTHLARREGVSTIAVPMTRSVSPLADVIATTRMTAVLRQLAPDVVNASTPKAGLVGMLAARAARVPVRVYLLRGLRLETTGGVLRAVLGVTERLASSCAHTVPCVSGSLLTTAVESGLVPSAKACVIGQGSSNGVDPLRFAASPDRVDSGHHRLRSFGIPAGSRVILFVGRFVADKGIAELLDAFRALRAARPDVHLLIVGADIGGEVVATELSALARRMDGVVLTGTTSDLAPLYAACEVLAFPSHREGFPNVVLEAAAAGLPAVGFRVTGTVDAIVHERTGLLVRRGDASALAEALGRLLDAADLRAAYGAAARQRVEQHFTSTRVWEAWLEFYRRQLDGAARHGDGRRAWNPERPAQDVVGGEGQP